ncbi:hypothetical protein QAD02_009802 [Eretmocerus hayati]|uniref:Uncharacterized protein n=1 Tax=Eretmocerus hayati TaxID=131215 RepID=A0ACC2NAC6_9HYME|nr:hypothetical protein QAD02_009802 [Eretmocerus hayati]
MNHRLPILLPPSTPPNCRLAHPIPTIQRLAKSGIIAPRSPDLCQLAPVTWGSVKREEPTTQEESSTSRPELSKNIDDDHARGRTDLVQKYEPPTTRARGRSTRWAPYVVYKRMYGPWQYTDDVAGVEDAHLGCA